MYKICEGNDYDKLYEVLSNLKNKKLKINDILIEKYKDMILNEDIEQNYYSRSTQGVYENGQDSLRLMKWLA